MASEQKTVRVRIAVAVDESGRWYGLGSPKIPEDVSMSIAADQVDGTRTSCWLTADLPVPTPIEVPATIEQERGNGE